MPIAAPTEYNAAMIALPLFLHGHVPTYSSVYGDCYQNCCTPPLSHKTSQVIYMRGSGGLEIEVESLSQPFDIEDGEVIHFDVVLRDDVDLSTFQLFIGCGGCGQRSTQPQPSYGLQPARLEPFTQTVYRSALPKDMRTFDSTLLRPSLCPEQRFAIYLADFQNRSDGQQLVWAPVIGLGESFTAVDMLRFPIFILNNHGGAWTELSWTIWVHVFVAAPLLLSAARILYKARHDDYPYWSWRTANAAAWPVKHIKQREVLYDIALLFYLATAIEILVHLFIAQSRVGWPETEFWLSLFAVASIPNGIGALFVLVNWRAAKSVKASRGAANERRWWHRLKDAPASRAWSAVEILMGSALLFLLGAGIFGGPVCIILGGIAHACEPSSDTRTQSTNRTVPWIPLLPGKDTTGVAGVAGVAGASP